MENDNIQFKDKIVNDWQVLTICGRIDTITANIAENKAKEILDSCTKLALDLEDLEYISSAGLRVLLRLAKKAQKENKKFCLVNINDLVKEILEESGLDVLFTILSNEKQLI